MRMNAALIATQSGNRDGKQELSQVIYRRKQKKLLFPETKHVFELKVILRCVVAIPGYLEIIS